MTTGELIRKLAEAGAPPEAIAVAVEALEQARAEQPPAPRRRRSPAKLAAVK